MVVYLIQRYYNFGVFTRAVKPTQGSTEKYGHILNYIVSSNIILNAQINKTTIEWQKSQLYLKHFALE